MIKYSNLSYFINQDDFLTTLSNFREYNMSNRSQILIIDILEEIPIQRINDYEKVLGAITNLVKELRKSSNYFIQ